VDPPSDADLVRRLRAGDVAAFDEAYERYHRRLYGFLARLLGRRDLAEDLLQETWLRLAAHASGLRDDAKLLPWLFTVARNLCTSFLRWRVLEGRVSGVRPTEEGGASPFELAAASELERRLEAAIAALPLRYREVVLLVCVEGLAPQDAARVLGLRPEAVRQRLLRGRDMIQSMLEGT
jgi:RNA polymerase sigma-70 factor (ECF subfamily)